MKRVLFVISSLEYSGAARQLTLLASNLPRDRFEVHVCTLGGLTPWAEDLQRANIPVHALGRSRLFDLLPFLALRRLLRNLRANVVHVWDRVALRATALMTRKKAIWASAALPAIGQPGRFDRWLLRRVGRIVALGAADAARYLALDIPPERITVIDPAAANLGNTPTRLGLDNPSGKGIIPPHGSRPTGPVVVVLGPFLSHKGARHALWALDILHHLYPKMTLVLAGAPPSARELAGLSHIPLVHHLGRCAEVNSFLAQADVVWVPARAGGVSAAVEAMAAGKAVVAARTPELMEIVEDNVTGLLFQPGEGTDLARQARMLLDDPVRRQAMGEAARRRAAERFAPGRQATRYTALFDGD